MESAMRLLTVIGARPQFVKAALVSNAFSCTPIQETIVHTGQHYDPEMSDVFFEELAIPAPRYHLGVGSGYHGAQTGEMMRRLEEVTMRERPDWVLVYGDTNSTLAGALVAAKLGIPLAHVEAGLRSFDRSMPEEINRVLTDHVSTLLFAPTVNAAQQLAREGISRGVSVVGDVMVDLALKTAERLAPVPEIVAALGVAPGRYGIVTIHRAANTDDAHRFRRIVEGLRRIKMPLVFPAHPRIRGLIERFNVGNGDGIRVCAPLGYQRMIALQARARVVLTDSGGIQKEAHALGVPCVTLRAETEWIETLEDGWNILAGADPDAIERSAWRLPPMTRSYPYGDGTSALRIVDGLLDSRSESKITVAR